MKVTCNQADLAKGLGLVGRAAGQRASLPILSHALLATTQDGRLQLAATNLEISICCWISSQVEAGGAAAVPAQAFGELVQRLPAEDVTLSLNEDKQKVRVTAGRVRANLNAADAEAFPLLPGIEGETAQLPAKHFKELINQVAFAAAGDGGRPVMEGVLLSLSGDRVTLAATDGYRLSVRSAALSGPAAASLQAIVPARALNELARITNDGGATLSLALIPGRPQAIFNLGNVVLVSQLIEGQFPDFAMVIPRQHTTRVVVETAELARATRMAQVIARQDNQVVRLQATPGDEGNPADVTVSATSAETGSSKTQIEAAVEGASSEILLDGRYLSQAVAAVATPQLVLEMSGRDRPVAIKTGGEDDFVHIIMPMRFDGR